MNTSAEPSGRRLFVVVLKNHLHGGHHEQVLEHDDWNDMTNYLVTYDLRKPGQNYDDLIKAIKSYKSVKVTESCWLVRSTNKADAIRDSLTKHMDTNDRIYVTPVARGAAWKNPLTDGDTIIKFLDGKMD